MKTVVFIHIEPLWCDHDGRWVSANSLERTTCGGYRAELLMYGG